MYHLQGAPPPGAVDVTSPRLGPGRRAVITFDEAKRNTSLLDAGVCLRDYRCLPLLAMRAASRRRRRRRYWHCRRRRRRYFHCRHRRHF